jgi:four helix bundle protein
MSDQSADVKSLESLIVWQKAIALAVKVHREILPILPQEEKWNLGSQIRRSAQSIPANIAEGYGRYYFQDTIRFCYIARGSLEETRSHVVLASKLDYLPDDLLADILSDIEEVNRLIKGYIAFMKRSKRGEKEAGASLSIHETPAFYDLYPDSEYPVSPIENPDS